MNPWLCSEGDTFVGVDGEQYLATQAVLSIDLRWCSSPPNLVEPVHFYEAPHDETQWTSDSYDCTEQT